MLTKRTDRSRQSGTSKVPTNQRVRSGPVVFDDGRAFGASLFTPAGTGRRHRRHHAREARGIEAAQREAWMERRRAEMEAVKAEQRSAGYLPKGGEKGPAALRSYRKLKVQPHRATSDVLAGAYPFLAEAGLGSDGVLIGTDSWSGAAFVYDPWVLYEQGVLTNPNQLLAGVIGKKRELVVGVEHRVRVRRCIRSARGVARGESCGWRVHQDLVRRCRAEQVWIARRREVIDLTWTH